MMVFVGNSTNAFYERSLTRMGNLRNSLEELQTQIATGVQIERGSDDPIGAARLRALDRLKQLGETEAENAARLGQDLTESANAIGGVVEILQRARELAIAASSDTLGASGLAAIADELEQMGEELFARANTSSITGVPLFAGTAGDPAYIRDPSGTVIYNGNGQVSTVPVAPGIDVDRGVTGPAVFEFNLAGGPSNTFAVIGDLAAALRGGTPDPVQSARDAIAGLDAGLDSANRSQTVIGARLAWVESIQQDQQLRAISFAEKRSEIGDTDVADAIVRLQQTLTALEASQASFTRVSSLTLFDLI